MLKIERYRLIFNHFLKVSLALCMVSGLFKKSFMPTSLVAISYSDALCAVNATITVSLFWVFSLIFFVTSKVY